MNRRSFIAAAAGALLVPASAPAQVGPAVFVLMVAIGAGILIIYITKKTGTPANHQFVLEKSYDNATWIPVATNYARMTVGQAFEVFQADMTDTTAFYRVRVMPMGSPSPKIASDGHAWAVVPARLMPQVEAEEP